MRPRPLPRRLDGGGLILLPALGDVGGERVVGVGGAEEGLDGEEDGADLQGGGPVACKKGGLACGVVLGGLKVVGKGDG
jgi:hypothetical protein